MNDYLETSMDMITHAGDARNQIQKAMELVENHQFGEAETLMKEAFENIKIAHIRQTNVIQTEMAKENEKSAELLFSHAQDTLMTISSEYNVAKQAISLYRKLDERISKLEGGL